MSLHPLLFALLRVHSVFLLVDTPFVILQLWRADRKSEGGPAKTIDTDFFLVMQAFEVVFQDWRTLPLAAVIICIGVDNIAGEHFLPEWEAHCRACR